jgi:transcription elongation factor Elf1
MRAVAIKKGLLRESAPTSTQETGTLQCDACGEQFAVYHDVHSADRAKADVQAHWLEKVLAEEHERDCKHADRIELPE